MPDPTPADQERARAVQARIFDLAFGGKSDKPCSEIVNECIATALAEQRKRDAKAVEGYHAADGTHAPDAIRAGPKEANDGR